MSAMPTVQELRQRAAMLSHFEVDWLTADLDADSSEVEDLLAVSERVVCSDGKRHWALDDSVRRGVVAATEFQTLRASWQAVQRRPDDERQSAIDEYLRTDAPRPMDRFDTAGLRTVQWLADWLGGAAPHIPDSASVRRALGRRELSASFRQMAGSGFVGRTELLATLAARQSGAALMLHGIGGIGKSALVGRHLLDIADGGSGYVGYITFEHSGVDPAWPAGIVAALARQLLVQVDEDRVEQAERFSRTAAAAVRHAAKAGVSGHRSLTSTEDEVRSLVDGLQRILDGRRYVVAFDAFEELQRRDSLAQARFGTLLSALSALPRSSVILAGRSAAPEFTANEMVLPGLSRSEATTFLRAELGGLADGIDVGSVLDVVGGSPLCIRLAAGVLRHGHADEAMRDLALHRSTIEGELYRRLLGSIDDAAVRRIAHPGLTLRRVTAELIREVLAKPCGVAVPDDATAERLFRGLAREAMLVVHDPSHGQEALVHRADVRQMMLSRLAADEPDATLRIHRAAVRYYSRQEGVRFRAEELYHRLMLRQGRRTIDSRWDDDALAELLGSLDELPPSAKAYLASKTTAVSLSAEDLAAADRETRLAVTLRQVRDDLAAGRVVTALDKIRDFQADEPSTAPELLDCEIQALARLGRLDDAAEIATRCRQRAARAGRIPEFVKFTLHLARLTEGQDDPARADALVAEALDLARPLPPDPANLIDRLTLTVYRLRLIRTGVARPAEEFEALTEQALALYDALPGRAVSRAPGLLRDLAAEVGDRSPRIQRAALRAVGLKTSGRLFAAALEDLDERVSSGRGVRPGVLTSAAIDLAESMANILDTFPTEWSGTAAELVTDDFRAQSDAAARQNTTTAGMVSVRSLTGSHRGVGFMVAPRLVLTVAHVVGPAGTSVLVSGAASKDRYSAVVTWRGTLPNVDAALLEIIDARWRPPLVDPPEWGRLVTSRPDVAAEVWTLPLEASAIHDPRRAFGRLTADESSPEGALVLSVPWAAETTVISGAPVFCGNLLTGLITGRFRHGLSVVSLESVRTDPEGSGILARHLDQLTPSKSTPVELVAMHAAEPPRTGRPTDLLTASRSIVPFRGRDAEMNRLRSWCDGAGSAVLLLHGSGGSGKTRTAWALVGRQQGDGWVTCWLSQDCDAQLIERFSAMTEPLLIVIDYAELRLTQVSAVLQAADRSSGAYPVRVLLLARSQGDWWHELKGLTPLAGPMLDVADVVHLRPWRREQGLAAYEEAVRLFAAWYKKPAKLGNEALGEQLDRRRLPADALPLTIHMMALADVLDGGAAEGADAAGVESRMLLHERRYWRRTAEDAGLLDVLDERDLFDTLAVALLLGADDQEQSERLVARVLTRSARDRAVSGAVRAWIGSLYPAIDGRPWGELQPDRLAEHLLGDRLVLNRHLFDPALPVATPGQLERLLVHCARAAQQKMDGESVARQVTDLCLRHADLLAVPALTAVTKVESPGPLLDALTQLVRAEDTPQELLFRLADQLPRRSLHLADFAVELSRRVARLYWRTRDRHWSADLRLARSLSELAIRWVERGKPDKALPLSQETVSLYRRLVDADPARFLAGLATSLSNLSVNLVELGLMPEGLVAVREAVAIRRTLAESDPDAHRPELAASLNNLATQLSRLGAKQEALSHNAEAVQLYRELVTTDPDRFLPDLAMALSNFSVDHDGRGQTGEGLAAIHEAVAIRRGLAARNPDAYLPDLAASLLNLAAQSSRQGRFSQAIAFGSEAVRLFRELTARNPDRFLPGLAMALSNLSVDQSEVGLGSESLVALEESVAIRQELAKRSPHAYLPDLAASFQNLGTRLSRLNRPQEALHYSRQALDLYEQLNDANPGRFRPDLATALNNFSVRMAELGRSKASLAICVRAVAIYEELADSNPQAYLPGLARSWHNFSACLSDLGRREEGLAAMQVTVEIRRRLAEADPDEFRTDLVASLKDLSACLGDLGRREEGLAAMQEAVGLLDNASSSHPRASDSKSPSQPPY